RRDPRGRGRAFAGAEYSRAFRGRERGNLHVSGTRDPHGPAAVHRCAGNDREGIHQPEGGSRQSRLDRRGTVRRTARRGGDRSGGPMTQPGVLDPTRLVAIDTHVHLESEAAGSTATDAAARQYFGADSVPRDPESIAAYYRAPHTACV